jgi:hypothetical protein
MPCFKTDTKPAAGVKLLHGYLTTTPYSTQQECDQKCGEVGACCTGGATCRQAKPCACSGTSEVFIGQGVPCAPNPCNPLP